MFRETMNALAACVVTFALCAVAYPAAVWGLAWLAFPHQADGSLIERDGKVIGSELIAQPFASDTYFFPRPSAVDYKADAAGGSNLGTKNPDLRTKVKERAEALKATDDHPAPAELVTASGGGLDPHISPEGARYQAARVAAARKLPLDRVLALIDRHLETSGSIIGAPPRVNVLGLNLALDEEHPAPAAGGPGPAPVTEALGPSSDLASLRARVAELSNEVDRIAGHVDETSRADALKALEARVAGLSEAYAGVAPLSGRVSGIDRRIADADEGLRRLKSELGEARDALKAAGARPARRPGP